MDPVYTDFKKISDSLRVDRLCRKSGMIRDIVFDIILVENQLPIFILQDLFLLAQPNLPDTLKMFSLYGFASIFLDYYVCQAVPIPPVHNIIVLMQSYFPEAKHFVDLLRLCLQPPNRDDTERVLLIDSKTAANIRTLHQSGIKFEKASAFDKTLLEIEFISKKKVLVIPQFIVSNLTLHLLRNLQIFEELHCDTNYVNDYGVLLHRLLSTPEDVELLTEMRVIVNQSLGNEEVSTFFQELSRDARDDVDYFYYTGLVKDLLGYCESRRHKWKANLKQNYFSNPWASISVIRVFIMLILTFIQAVCSILALLQ
ncbi:hypothetical protein Dsin_010722 [Dipteronia sinensis]|uniref:Uncharacterized protein n=1 Tax=Dipteronia sinensis TaxID=43782 RepID=A0AAE0ATC4_9ROSI|nr:hypothetical protein Dsin_010722 [Dipteronia sinensis]